MREITRIGLDRAPQEACGVLLPTPRNHRLESQVVELPNRALVNDQYRIQGDDVRLALADWAQAATPEERNAVAVWHTHPGGNIGPSPGDLKNRIEGACYLVVALDLSTGTGIPTWF